MRYASLENYIKVHGDKYDYSETVFSSKNRKIDVRCKKHDLIFSIDKFNHGKGYGCPLCNGKVYNTEQFKIKACEVHGNSYNYDKSIYTKSSKKLIITCLKHGDFEQKANHHLSGHGCNKCAIEFTANSKLISRDEYIARAIKVHGNKYSYDNLVYTKIKDNVTITCPKHGDFSQIAEVHISNHKSGCPSCTRYGFKRDKPAILYYLEITKGNDKFYKIGITNRTVKGRYKFHDRKKFIVLFTKHYEKGIDAYNEEQRLLSKYKEHIHTGSNILANGNSEIFTSNVLSCYIT